MNALNLTVVSLLAAAMTSVLVAGSEQPAGPNGAASVEVRLEASDPRPLAAAVIELTRRHNAVITYEDAPCDFAGDQSDVTEQVRLDLDQFPAGQAPRVLIPKGGSVDIAYEVDRATGQPADLASVLDKAALSHRDADNAGRYGVIESHGALHIVPIGARDANGAMAAVTSPLDSVVRLPVANGNGIDRLEAILAAASAASGRTVVVGTVPASVFGRLEGQFAATNVNARTALLDLFAQTGVTMSWQMNYDPTMQVYVFNVFGVERD
jgi:hypothetical protein